MTDNKKYSAVEDIASIGRLLWEKDLASGLNGNISARQENTIFMTGHGTCLGFLKESDIVKMNMDGKLLGDGHASTETALHSEIYKNFPDIKAIIHTHTKFINGYFLQNNTFTAKILESKIFLGNVNAIKQITPSVTDVNPVIHELKKNNIVVLQNHGVVAVGQNLLDCFFLVQTLEDAIQVDAVSRLYQAGAKEKAEVAFAKEARQTKKYKLFSKEQMDEIVRLVNSDEQLKKLGESTNMTMQLAVKLDETAQTYCFEFEKGRIKNISHNDNAEFVVSAPEKVWRAVFAREIDPFVATTQKKMTLKGDFAKISKWYAPCSRLFELWSQVSVE